MYYNVVQAQPYNARPFHGYNGIGSYGAGVPVTTAASIPSAAAVSPMVGAAAAPGPTYEHVAWDPATHWKP